MIKQNIFPFLAMIVNKESRGNVRNYVFLVCNNQQHRNHSFVVRMPCSRFVPCVINFKLVMLLSLQIYLKSSQPAEAENAQRKILHIMELSKVWFYLLLFLSLFLFQKTWRNSWLQMLHLDFMSAFLFLFITYIFA